MYEGPRAPYGVEEGCGCGCDPFARVLSLLLARDQESSRSAGHCCRPGAELLCQARGGTARVTRGYNIRHDRYAIEGMACGGRTTVQRAKQIRRFNTACAVLASAPCEGKGRQETGGYRSRQP